MKSLQKSAFEFIHNKDLDKDETRIPDREMYYICMHYNLHIREEKNKVLWHLHIRVLDLYSLISNNYY